MKKIYLLLSVFTLIMASCSDLSNEERFEIVKPAEVSRSVLIEDFTGQLCVNCPAAADTIASLQKQYGADHVIAVSIHGGDLSMASRNGLIGLKTDDGEAYTRATGVNSWPMGLINRVGGLCNVPDWNSRVYEEIQRKTPLQLTLTVEDKGSDRLAVDVKGLASATVEGRLQLWLTEDSIVAIQRMKDGQYNNAYLHSHVLRKMLNGQEGESFKITENDGYQMKYQKEFALPVDQIVNKEHRHLHVVLIASDKSSGEVIGVCQASL